MAQFSDLLGKELIEITGKVGDEEMRFITKDGQTFKLYHQEDCCESVNVNDIVGDLSDLLNSPILQAEEVCSENIESERPFENADSWTWTFYKLATIKGYVTIKWLGESNGYYSESVSFSEAL